MKKIDVWPKTQVEANCESCRHLSKQDDLYICQMGAYDVDMSATLLFDKECESYKLNHKSLLCDFGYEESIVFKNPDYDSAIIGVTHDGRVVYEYDKMVEDLMKEDNMTEFDAMDFIDYNTIRTLPYAGDKGPIVMHMLDNM